MAILVLGGAGYIGSHMVDRLVEKGHDFLPKDEGSAKDILSSFRPPKFSTAHDFYKAFAGRFCMQRQESQQPDRIRPAHPYHGTARNLRRE